MHELLSHTKQALQWQQEGQRVAVATVVSTWGSSPRRPGAQMLITHDLLLAGSVSAGCVESAVIQAALEVLETQTPQLLHFGVADDDALQVGLACGGEIAIFVQPWEERVFLPIQGRLQEEESCTLLTILGGPSQIVGAQHLLHQGEVLYSDLSDDLQMDILPLLLQPLDAPKRGRATLSSSGEEVDYFLQRIQPAPLLVILGGNHIALALAKLANIMGYRIAVIDPRDIFATPERFPEVDHLFPSWPQEALPQLRINEQTAFVLLTHDPKIDDIALDFALRSRAGYIGALGSRRTHAKRLERLQERGFSAEDLDRVYGPVGLAIHAETPEQIALSILTEIVLCQKRPALSPRIALPPSLKDAK